MSNKKALKVPINKERFLEALRYNSCSLRKLGNAYDEIGRTEKNIRRCLNSGEMPPDLLNNIAKYLNVHPDYLSGIYDKPLDKIEGNCLRKLFKSFIRPEKFPYLLKRQSDIGYITYFEIILTMNGISMEQFNTLLPEERILFRQEMEVAISTVIAKYFIKTRLAKIRQIHCPIANPLLGILIHSPIM